jgi:hypothetical protein
MNQTPLSKIEACVAFKSTLIDIVDDYYLPVMEQKTSAIPQLLRTLSSDWAKDLFQQMPPDWMECLPTTVLAYECFKECGIFAKRPELESEANTGVQSRQLCQAFHEKPWRYSFCKVTQRVQSQFFAMVDILSGEAFELYSKGIEETLQEQEESPLFGLLLFWNGHCWQTYSTISYFVGYQAHDLLSFARAIDPTCVDKPDVYRVLDKNFLQFLALFRFAEAPITLHQEQELGFSQTTCTCDELPLEALAEDFKITKVQGVYRLELKPYPDRMLEAEAFWSPKTKELIVEASTAALRAQLRAALLKHGVQIPPEPDFEMGMPMRVALKAILQKELNTPLARRFQR